MSFGLQILTMLLTGLQETAFMVALSSLLSYLIGIPLGILLIVMDRNGIRPNGIINTVPGIIINLMRPVPLIVILLTALLPTRFVVRTMLGPKAIVMPFVLAVMPYIARMIESSLKGVGVGVVEVARLMGVSNFQIVRKIMLPEVEPSLLMDAAIFIMMMLGYSTVAGFVGGGGLGTLVVNYDYYRYQTDVVLVTVVVLVITVQLTQEGLLRMARHVDKCAC